MLRKPMILLFAILALTALACGSSAEQPTAPADQASSSQSTQVVTLPLVAGENEQQTAESTQVVVLPIVEDNANTPQPPEWTPAAQAEAQQAIQDYARDVLGIEVQILIGTGLIQDLSLPLLVEEGANDAIALSGVTYFGVWDDGIASLSMGEGSVSGDTNADLQEGSLGIFSLRMSQAMPEDANAALALIKQTYPGLVALDFYPDAVENEAFAFSTSKAQDYSIRDGQATLSGTLITAGVSPARRPNMIMVWVVVASGALATPLE
ncbi:MAG: hypothetical protein JW726_11235 [Anaerolineales bacterium]|nr:hypothetical protein [Anaerolineales bacterium]